MGRNREFDVDQTLDITTICLIIVVGLLLTACTNGNGNNAGNNANVNNNS